MPIYQIDCPDCGHTFSGMVFAGTREPEIWVCGRCGSEKARPREDASIRTHPLEVAHGAGCPCCGGTAVTDG